MSSIQQSDRFSNSRSRKNERGIALIVSILMLVLVTSIAIHVIGSSEEELRAGGRSRSTSKSLYAAEAGVNFAENRLTPPSDTDAFTLTMADGTVVMTGKRTDSAAQDIVDDGLGTPPSGYSINIGNGFINETYKVNVTASKIGAATSEVEVRLGILTPNSGSN